LSVFTPRDHLGLDFHDYYNALPGSGLTSNGDGWTFAGDSDTAWTSGWAQTHTQDSFVNVAAGSQALQQAVLRVPITTAEKYGALVYIGEWGAARNDPNVLVYQRQMLDLFMQDQVSWARWDLNKGSDEIYGILNTNGSPAPQGLQLSTALAINP